MLLTAQRVRTTRGEEGINSFCYHHGPSLEWFGEPPEGIPEANPGRRVNADIDVNPGGNLVESYLDIIAPDETPTYEITAAVPRFLAQVRSTPPPWVATVGRCTFRFFVQPALAHDWAAEFKTLLGAALGARVPV